MDNFLAARSQMALSLAFHIVFSCIGMVMPFFMAVAHFIWLRTGNPLYKNISIAWSKGVAIFFATGAVSGTVLSFEMGLLWPEFMKHAGPVFGMPFSLEGTAFFIEAIALGFFLYGWNRFNRWFHWFTGVMVGLTGILSGILVVAANSWMNSPAGFDFKDGVFSNIDPLKAMFNKGWFSQALHMTIAAFVATGFAVAGIHAWMILRKVNTGFHRAAFRIAAGFAVVAALLQPLSGDLSAKFVAKNQPAKLAAMEAHFKTEPYSALIIGGIPDMENKKVDYAIRIPGMLSFMANGDARKEVKGLDMVPLTEQPNVPVTHYAFQLMVGFGMALFGISVLSVFASMRKKDWLTRRWFYGLFVLAIPMGYIAVEAGWVVTEVGRQPWIIQGILKTADAVTPMPGIMYSFYCFLALYVFLSFAVSFLLYRQIKTVPVL
ncbi:MAG TPA: cytochrome ubiquinol oxidase subunit I [Chitinophagaceae bacterium]|nr:cytochrome ubiquinol oxidase subunit I [Chitinophagaceae bacterium]